VIALAAFTYAFWLANLSPFVIFGVIVAAGFAVQHQRIAKTRARDACFRAFLENHRFGAALFIGTVLGVL
jgi:4-hydroxybenzoate polyprenyltransferase